MSIETLSHSDLTAQFFTWGLSVWAFWELSRYMARDLEDGVQEPSAEFRVPCGVARVVMIRTQPDIYRLEVWPQRTLN